MNSTLTKGYNNPGNSEFSNKLPSAVKKPMTADINMKRRKFTYQPRNEANESHMISPRTTDYDTINEGIEDIQINDINSFGSPREFSPRSITIDENQRMRNEFMRNEAFLKEQNNKL